MPHWTFPQSNLHAVFPTRQRLVPAVRCFIDFLAKRLPKVASEYDIGNFAGIAGNLLPEAMPSEEICDA
ncbi:MAG TPA: hypothetical protein VHK70_06120 [Burkholderiaceae bacterium]|nr:hypothetical protein [Burkholderiaceae bacterium]